MTSGLDNMPASEGHPVGMMRRSRFRHVVMRADVSRRHVAGYSRFVSMMKYVLPAAAAVLIVLVAIWPHIQPQDTRFRVGFSGLAAREAAEPSMLNARYVGTDEDSQLFSVTADLAKNLLQGIADVELEMPKADISLEDGSWLVLTANTGVFNRTFNTLDLIGAVNLFHDFGYEIRTSRAFVDLEHNVAAGTEPVEGQGPFGELRSEGFRLEDKGRLITFTGKASLILYSGPGGSAK
jgi:lipopolysaccharide export system protein LptC